jgi:uncharacterized protein (DUF4415 family)
MKKEDTVSYTSEELKAKPSKTDWVRIDAMTEDEIALNAKEDPNAPPITEEQWETAVLVVPDDEGKERIALWIDKDVLRHFGKGSKGYQKRLNTALRKIMVAELLYGRNITA